eukprot:m.9163 g.9163  ORF g.9163 m.9163 type:complete len:55 (-) comp2940_c0_seq2:407-571(-)
MFRACEPSNLKCTSSSSSSSSSSSHSHPHHNEYPSVSPLILLPDHEELPAGRGQ